MNRKIDASAVAFSQRLVTTSLFLGLMFFGTVAHARWPKSKQDFAQLPRYCSAKLLESAVPEAEVERWAKRIGPDYRHIHHYCAALHNLRLANSASDENERKEFLQAVVNEINYVEHHSTPTFFMRAETGVQKGRALLRLNDVPGAIASFNNALKVNQRFAAAYAGIADAYLLLNQPLEAKAVLERGIKAVPNSKNLRMRRAALK